MTVYICPKRGSSTGGERMKSGTRYKVYIAGPYSQGDVITNIRTALSAAHLALDAGFIPFIPHLSAFWHLCYEQEKDMWLDYGKEWLQACDVVWRLTGPSEGADAEVALARELGIPV